MREAIGEAKQSFFSLVQATLWGQVGYHRRHHHCCLRHDHHFYHHHGLIIRQYQATLWGQVDYHHHHMNYHKHHLHHDNHHNNHHHDCVIIRQCLAFPLPGLPERGWGLSRSILHTSAPGLSFNSFCHHRHHHPHTILSLTNLQIFLSLTGVDTYQSVFPQVGKPMYYMETALGQYARLSPLQV